MTMCLQHSAQCNAKAKMAKMHSFRGCYTSSNVILNNRSELLHLMQCITEKTVILILILIHTNTSYRGREGRREGRGKGWEKTY